MISKNRLCQIVHAIAEKWLDELDKEIAQLTLEIECLRLAQPNQKEFLRVSETHYQRLIKAETNRLKIATKMIGFPLPKDDGEETYFSFVQRLEDDEEFRAEQEWLAELGRLSQEKSKLALYSWHVFRDGIAAPCILSAQSLEYLDQLEAKPNEENE